MALSPTSRLRFLSQSGEERTAPPEWQVCFVEVLDVDSALESLEVRRNDLSLPLSRRRVGDRYRTVAEWPLSGTGSYTLELVSDGQSIEALTCSVTPEKLSLEAYETLINDLQTRLPATVAIALQRAGALAGVRIVAPDQSTLNEELYRLRRACDGTPGRAGLVRVLEALARGPHQILANVEVWMPRDRARRVNAASLYRAFVRPMNLDERNDPQALPDHRVQHAVDTYENQLLAGFFDQVNLRLRRLLDAPKLNATTRDEAHDLLQRLSRARRNAEFLDEVSELSEPPTRLTMVLLKRSEYRAALEGFLEFRRTVLVQLDEPKLQAPLSNLPQLYETWGTLQVIQTLLGVAAALGYQVTQQRLTRRDNGQLWLRVLKDGAAAVSLEHATTGWRLELIPQRSYSAGSTTARLRSISFAKKPDVAVEVTSPQGNTTVWLFDPKYKLISADAPAALDDEAAEGEITAATKVGLPKPIDLNAMHAYRDAIRSSDGDRPVAYAATLYPGETRIYDDGLAALRAYPGEDAALTAELATVLRRALGPGAGRAAARVA